MYIGLITLKHIEKAMGFELYENQRLYLMRKGSLGEERKTGRTTAHCIRLALSEGEPIRLLEMDNFFRNEFMDVRKKLKGYGFPVREVII